MSEFSIQLISTVYAAIITYLIITIKDYLDNNK